MAEAAAPLHPLRYRCPISVTSARLQPPKGDECPMSVNVLQFSISQLENSYPLNLHRISTGSPHILRYSSEGSTLAPLCPAFCEVPRITTCSTSARFCARHPLEVWSNTEKRRSEDVQTRNKQTPYPRHRESAAKSVGKAGSSVEDYRNENSVRVRPKRAGASAG